MNPLNRRRVNERDISASDDLSVSQMSWQVHIRWSLTPYLSSRCSHFDVSFRLLTSQRGPGSPLCTGRGCHINLMPLTFPAASGTTGSEMLGRDVSVCVCVCNKHGGEIIK